MIFFLKPCFVTDAPSVCANLVKSRCLAHLLQVEGMPPGFVCPFRILLHMQFEVQPFPFPASRPPTTRREILAYIWWYIYKKRKRKSGICNDLCLLSTTLLIGAFVMQLPWFQIKKKKKKSATYPCPLEAAVFAASLTIAKGPKRRQLESLVCSLVPAVTFQFRLLWGCSWN